MATKHILSKSTFIRGLQCSKSLYLYKHYYKQRDQTPPSLQAIFTRGINVGILARDVFPGGVDCTPESVFKYDESVEKTKQLIESGTEVIYEAAFNYDGVLVAIDILAKREGRWQAYEVKSSTKVTDVYRADSALQYFVLKNSGLDISEISILYLNNQYVKKGKIEPGKLFTKVPVTGFCVANMKMIEEKVKGMKVIISLPSVPEKKIGKHCFEPYTCDYMGTCWKDIPPNSVFELAGMHREKQFEMYDSGIKTIADVPADYSLEKNQRVQVDATNTNTVLVDKTEITKFISSIKYPVYFFDIETMMPAVPMFEGTSPFQHLPFQYSLHYKQSVDGALQHFEFLAEAGLDPRKEFITNFIEHTKTDGCILVYNKAFENSVLNTLAKDFPEFESEIRNRQSRMIDLMEPFAKRHYYHPMMKGSHSIKNVLPALVPELNHNELLISDGGMAMSAFEQLQTETDLFKIAEIRENLLAYCKLDTLAMVKIFEVLEKA